jgi:hypothetical protein
LRLSFPIWCDVERRLRFCSIDDVRHRAGADDVLACLRGQATQAATRTLRPAVLRALNNMFRFGIVSPRK